MSSFWAVNCLHEWLIWSERCSRMAAIDPKLPFTKGRNRQGAATQFAAIPVMTLRGHLNVGMLAIQSELIGSARTQEEMRCTALPRI